MNILLKSNKGLGVGMGREGRRGKLHFVNGEAETESLIMWLVIRDWLEVGWWWRESQSLIKGWLEHIFCIPGLRT